MSYNVSKKITEKSKSKSKSKSRTKSIRIKSQQYKKLEKTTSGLTKDIREINKILSPLANIYSEERWLNRNFNNVEYFEIVSKYNIFFEKIFSDRKDILIAPSKPTRWWTKATGYKPEMIKAWIEAGRPFPINELPITVFDEKSKLSIDSKTDDFIDEGMNNSLINIIAIPYSVELLLLQDRTMLSSELTREIDIYSKDIVKDGHEVILVINKYQKTIEFFDSNGSDEHYSYTHNLDQKLWTEYLTERWGGALNKYKFLNVEDTCPASLGFQKFETDTNIERWGSSSNLGFCIAWSIFTIYLRIKYYYISSGEIVKLFLLKMRDEIPRTEPSSNGSEVIHKFIVNFVIYMREIIN